MAAALISARPVVGRDGTGTAIRSRSASVASSSAFPEACPLPPGAGPLPRGA